MPAGTFDAPLYVARSVAGWVACHPALAAVLVIVTLIVWGLLGESFGLPNLFWHELPLVQAMAGAAVTFVLAETLSVGYLVDRIRAIGTDRELVAATLEEARRLAGPDDRVQAVDLRKALAEFDAVWAAMTTPEQAEVAQALIERIDYDGRTKDINVVFRPERVRMLAVQEEP